MVSERGGRQWMVGNNTKSRSPVMTAQKLGGKESHVLSKSRGNHSSGQFIGRPQTFVELQLCFKLHFPSVKMQFDT